MSIQQQINEDIKKAMIAKDKAALEALRAAKTALTLAGTKSSAGGEVADDEATKELQRLVKQRKEAAEIYQGQDRADMAEDELNQAKVIQKYLPEQLSEDELKGILQQVIADAGATSMADMGKVMGAAMQKVEGKADGKVVSGLIRQLLS